MLGKETPDSTPFPLFLSTNHVRDQYYDARKASRNNLISYSVIRPFSYCYLRTIRLHKPIVRKSVPCEIAPTPTDNQRSRGTRQVSWLAHLSNWANEALQLLVRSDISPPSEVNVVEHLVAFLLMKGPWFTQPSTLFWHPTTLPKDAVPVSKELFLFILAIKNNLGSPAISLIASRASVAKF